MLLNLIQLGSVLDYRRYSADDDADIQDDEEYIPPRDLKDYAEAKDEANELRSWLFAKVRLLLEGMAEDGLESNQRLKTLTQQWFCAQCQCLILHKLQAEQLNYEGVHARVTAEAIKAAIEEDFLDDVEFRKEWPAAVEGGVQE